MQESEAHDLIKGTTGIQQSMTDEGGHERTCAVCYKIEVKDEGIGISQDNLKNLFIDFGKLDQSDNNINREGTGLGLSICKSIVETMGGNVFVDSKLGFGTTFTIFLRTEMKVSSRLLCKLLGDQSKQSQSSLNAF